ncbi:MAG: PAS domain S-box protein [Anaerolineales bacterium]|nr:PAS domain S-box protein [Anaerolineales bacterium]
MERKPVTGALHVMLLEHHPDEPARLEAELRRSGFTPRLEIVATKAEFLRALDLDLDVILAELDVPHFPLHEAIRLLQSRGHDTPVIALVDPASEAEGPEAVRHGARDYVLKDHRLRLGPAVSAALERRLEQAQLQSEAQPVQAEPLFQAWFESSPFGLSLTDADGVLLQANAALFRLGGYGPGALPRLRHLARLFDPPESVQRILRGLRDTDAPHQSTLNLKLAGEGTREALVTAVPIRTAEGVRVLWTVEDVADWVQAERSLQESRTEMAEIFAAALDGILMLDVEQRILLLNPAAERIFGLASEELLGRPVSDVFHLDQVEPEPYIGAPRTVEPRPGWLPTGGAVLQGRRAEQLDFPAEVMVSRFRFRGSERFVVLVRDITERKAAEDALRESEANYRGIFEGVQDAIMVQGLDREILDVNQRACEMYGYTRDELLARPVADLVPPGRDMTSSQALLEASRGGRLFETTDVRADGHAFPAQISASLQSLGGKPRVLVVVRDITEAKLAEQEIRRRAAHLEALNSIIAAAATPGDARSLLLVTLEHTLQALGLSVGCAWAGDDWVCAGLLEGHDPARLHRVESGLVDAHGFTAVEDWSALPADSPLLSGARDSLVIGLHSSLTVPIPMLDRVIGGMSVASAEPHAWSAEEISLVQAVAHQIGGAVHRLRLLHWTQGQARQLQTVLDSAPEGFLVLDGTRRVRTVNPLAEEYLRTLATLDADGALTELGGRPLSSMLIAGTEGRLHQITSSDQPPRVFDVQISPILLDLETQGWVVTLREVTEQQHLQQEAEQQRNLAAIGRMAAGIAHDFNNLLGPILLHTEMLRRDASQTEHARARLGTIQEQAQRAAGLVQQILDFSRKTIMEQRPIELGAFLDSVLSLLHRTVPENISLSFTREGDSFPVRADSTRLQQVFLNLAANARDAMPDGGELRIGLKRLTFEAGGPLPYPEISPGSWVRITFEDTGTGIPADDLPYLFEPFYSTKGAEGTGLGLAQAFGIVRQHGGHILAESPPGAGARFTIYLPLETDLVEEAAPADLAPLEGGHGETILVVEDNVATRQAMCEILDMLNYKPIAAENGRQAIEVLGSRPDIALVISDMVMPQMGGKALHEMISATYPAIKVILMTGYPLGEEDRALLTRRGVIWLGKPIGPDILSQVVRRTLATSS